MMGCSSTTESFLGSSGKTKLLQLITIHKWVGSFTILLLDRVWFSSLGLKGAILCNIIVIFEQNVNHKIVVYIGLLEY